MKILEAYQMLQDYKGAPAQVFCWTRQDRAKFRYQVSIYKIRDAEIATRREREQYERFIGVFDSTVSLADFTEACQWACEQFRLADSNPEPVLRRTGTDRVVWLPNAKRPEHSLEQGSRRPQDSYTRNVKPRS